MPTIKSLLIAVLVFWGLLGAAHTQVAVRNFDGGGTSRANQISRMDVNGNHLRGVDAGKFVQFAGDPHIYWYVPTEDVGFLYTTGVGTFGGFEVYSSVGTDVSQWVPVGEGPGGVLFDASSTPWQTLCSGPVSGTVYPYCYSPLPVFRPGTNDYVVWFGNNLSFYTLRCARPTGGCDTTPVEAASCTGTNRYLPTPFIDNDGTGYITFTVHGVTQIQQLNASYTDCVGPNVAVDASGPVVETPSMFRAGSTYFITAGTNCAYCGVGSTALYWTAPTSSTPVSATWSTSTGYDSGSSSCHGQPYNVAHLFINATEVFLLQINEYDPGNGSNANTGAANAAQGTVAIVPLTVSGSTISPFTCTATVSIPGAVPQPLPGLSGTDQSTENNPSNSVCDIGGANQTYQTFTAGRSGALTQVWVETGQGNNDCLGAFFGGTCPNPVGVNADLTVNVVNDSAGTPGAGLATATVLRSSVRWAPNRTVIPLSPAPTVSAGSVYGIRLSSPSATLGCWNKQAGHLVAYTGGQEYISTNSGSTWTPVASTDIAFSTVVGIPGGGRRIGHGR